MKWLLLALTALAAVPMLGVASAQAAGTWGELSHFGEKGEIGGAQKAFGVNPEDGSVWVGDVAVNGGKEEFRIQKFEKGTAHVLASEDFSPVERTFTFKGEEVESQFEIEGIAFDPGLHRAYVLLSEERFVLEEETQTAAQLWVFNTQTSTLEGKKLVDRTEGAYKGPVGEKAFDPQAPGTASPQHLSLKEPSGIAVNPANHDIAITGSAGNEHGAVWELDESGQIIEDWEEKREFFNGETPVSPVFANGKLFVLDSQGQDFSGTEQHEVNGKIVHETVEFGSTNAIYEMPASLNKQESPKAVFYLPDHHFCTERERYIEAGGLNPPSCSFIEELTEFEASGPDQLAVGSNGDFYVSVKLTYPFEGGVQRESAVMVLSPSFEEIGYTGGGEYATGTRTCAIDTSQGGVEPLLATSGEDVFSYESGKTTDEAHARRIALYGPGGSIVGCPQPSATLKASVSGTPVEAGTPIPVGTKVAFETSISEANALGTTWEVEGVTEKRAREGQHTHFEHVFSKPGQVTIKETILTDDLAAAPVVKETTLTIVEEGAPRTEAEAATGVGSTEATLVGKVNPEATSTTCKFQYGTTTAYGSEAACAPEPGSGSGFVAVSAALKGLTTSTAYHYRLVAMNSKGQTTTGSDHQFSTTAPATAPVATTGAVAGISPTAATLTGTVNPEGALTTCHFEYGSTTAYGSVVACAASAGTGRGGVSESAGLTGLTASTTYHYRIVASSALGGATGADASFTTAASPPPPPPPPPCCTVKPPPTQEVKGTQTVKPVPVVTIAGVALTVSSSGAFSLKLSCPTGETSCSGSVSLKTLTAVAASAHTAKAKKAILTLASGSFTVLGGKLKVLTLHLSSKAKKLLAKLHTVRARVTIVAHDSLGGAHTTTAIVTLKAAKAKKKH